LTKIGIVDLNTNLNGAMTLAVTAISRTVFSIMKPSRTTFNTTIRIITTSIITVQS